ncbi:MAG: hypothetical protein OXP11_15170 [Gammaproteobacteria bacterium]|nr:hypothetical protein [Gammaproteobacteria bacterium]
MRRLSFALVLSLMPVAAFGDDVVPLEEVEAALEEVNDCIGEDAETDAKAVTFLLAQETYPEPYARELATPAEVAAACNLLSPDPAPISV